MPSLRHVMIMASAGSGKTYALTNRFVELLAAGAAPERIVALTFTRKAAGEFFDEILHKLARAASDEPYARQLGHNLGRPELDRAAYLALLRRMVDAMPRLKLGTLDSFFSRIASAFPLELGLSGQFEILQEHAARVERQRVLQRMFARTSGALAAAQTEFIEAFKRATFGTEEKRLGARLDAFLDEHQEDFLAAPAAALWGDPRRIWPKGTRWLDDTLELPRALSALRAALGPLTDGQRVRWDNFFVALAEWTPGAPLAPPVEYVLKNALLVWRDLCDGEAEITIDRRKVPLSPDACRALVQVITRLVGAEISRHLESTRGVYAVLRSYENTYHDAVRRLGRLTFSDVQRLLAPSAGAPLLSVRGLAGNAEQVPDGGADSPRRFHDPTDGSLLAGASADERRLLLDYRLDAEIDHWLLDEFQDTSFGQWSVLRNLIDEVVQDTGGRRSFFCVGDVKQAIYAWREGDPRLFREIFDHYNAAVPDAIEERHLVASFRSGPALIAMVNAVFGAAATLADLFPGEASAAWNHEWHPHESALPERRGHAALLHGADEAERWAITRTLIEEIKPLDRGLTCAVLVKKNATAAALADYLRRAGIPAIAESDLHIATDNPLGAALLAFAQAAAHPGDTLAWEHLQMTPLAAALAARGLTTREALTTAVLAQIYTAGFERAFEFWIRQLEPQLAPDDAFSRLRAREFVAAAGLFDATGSRNLDEFIAFMERHTVRAPDSAAVVRVMTIHKSKGLGFDVVVIPDLQGNRIDERRDGLAIGKGPDRAVEWVLDLPPRLFCEQDEVLAAYVRAAESDACYENLSLLYVAMTRAKRALYLVTEPVGKSKSRNFPRLLADTLGHDAVEVRVGAATLRGPWSAGDAAWHETITASAASTPTPAAALSRLAPGIAAPVPRYVGRRPSGGHETSLGAAALFSLETRAIQAGSDLHAMLAQVEWAAAADADHWSTTWKAAGWPAALVESGVRCLAALALAGVWAAPGGNAAVWRERAFEIVLDAAWISGVFDRVVVARAVDGTPRAATVYDFKTDAVATPAAVEQAASRHAEQLALYRRVVAVLTGLPVTAVRAEIVFTAIGRSVALP